MKTNQEPKPVIDREKLATIKEIKDNQVKTNAIVKK